MSSKPLNPNAEPYYLQHQKLSIPIPSAIGFSQYGRRFHPYPAYAPCGFGLFPPNHFVNQEALDKNAKEGGMQRRGSANLKKSRGFHEKKKVQAEWRVREANEKKKPPENGGVVARRAVIPFPTTAEEAEVSKTTTVMIRNVPNQFKLGDLLRVLDNHCFELNRAADPADFSEFDFVYLPMDYRKHVFERRKSNLGYAFVNFTTASAAFKFYERFNGVVWDVFTNRKVCEVSAAQYQGKENLLKIFSSKIFVCNSPGFLPLVFLAARNGFNHRSKGTPVGKHVWGLPKRTIRS